jgi:hypothetical protein
MTNVTWYVSPATKCDLVGYSGPNCTGARYVVRIFPTGTRKGTFRTEELKSLVILAPVGHRVYLCTSDAETGWEREPWRCIRMMEGHLFTNEQGQRGVRVPDLDWQDSPEARRASTETQQSFPLVQHPSEGKGWTFGRLGGVPLKGNVRAIRIERE